MRWRIDTGVRVEGDLVTVTAEAKQFTLDLVRRAYERENGAHSFSDLEDVTVECTFQPVDWISASCSAVECAVTAWRYQPDGTREKYGLINVCRIEPVQ